MGSQRIMKSWTTVQPRFSTVRWLFSTGRKSRVGQLINRKLARNQHVGDRVNIFLARLCFRGIYFPMMRKSLCLRVLVENRRTILRLFKEGVFRWMLPRNSDSRDSFDVATPNVSGEANT